MSIKNLEKDNQLLEDDELLEDDYEDNNDFEEESEYIDDDDDDDDDEEEYEEESEAYKKAYRKKKRKKTWRNLKISFSLIMIFIILGISALLSVTIIFLAKEYLGIDKPATTYIVEIPENASTSEIIDILYDRGIIKVKELFELSMKISDTDKPIISGEHEISPSMDYGDILDELKTNNQEYRETVTVTFPEGINVYEASKLLEEEGVCDARNFVYYFNGGFDLSEYKFNSYLPTESTLKFLKLEGYLFPDTYEFYKDEDAEIVCRKIFNNFENKITDEYYAKMQELNMSLDEVITLASIVQKEAGNISDMKNIASVFHNRLNNPDTFPKLESDPTRIYAEDVIHNNSDIINTNMENAYNTYESAGLPPGAICNPGIDAIEAVLYPSNTNYFYFCADVESGITYFAETLEGHNANLELAGISVY